MLNLSVITVIYFEYAWSLFFKKNQLETKLIIDPKLKQPLLSHDEVGFVVFLPEPSVREEEISFLGYRFPAEASGKLHAVTLFKACVFHLGAHVAFSNFDAYSKWEKGKDSRLAKFAESLVEDTKANTYILFHHPDKLKDIAFANSLAFRRMKSLGRIWNSASRVMGALLLQTNLGVVEGDLKADEQQTVNQIADRLRWLKNEILNFFTGEQANVNGLELKVVDNVYHTLEPYRPVLEAPSFPHTEQLSYCTLFPPCKIEIDDSIRETTKRCLMVLKGGNPKSEFQNALWDKAVEAEALQVFDAWSREKAKEAKILSKYEALLSLTRFRSISFPDEDYTEYLRAKTKTKSETRRLIDSLLVAFDALDEDPRKLFGVLDLQDIIQVMASKSPRLDVFMREENISKSYAWMILLDASGSVKAVSEDIRDFGICLAETAKELLIDPSSWGLYAFNDRFLILKDMAERYNPKVKARIGGLKFEGFTFMPDALRLAGEFLKSRIENLRLITVVSDGRPYGYPKIAAALKEILHFLEKVDINVLGVGVKTNRMKEFFRANCNVRCIRDLTKKFSNLFLEACKNAASL